MKKYIQTHEMEIKQVKKKWPFTRVCHKTIKPPVSSRSISRVRQRPFPHSRNSLNRCWNVGVQLQVEERRTSPDGLCVMKLRPVVSKSQRVSRGEKEGGRESG